jgi:DHA1 family tetracycline resistance protein-like MFS transporter
MPHHHNIISQKPIFYVRIASCIVSKSTTVRNHITLPSSAPNLLTSCQFLLPHLFSIQKMCSTAGAKTNKNDRVVDDKMKSRDPALKRGVLYGTISLALVVLANTITMAHYQSQRDKLGCDSMCVGSMTSARSTLTLLGSALIGRCSDSTSLDKVGGARRIALLVGVLASAVGVVIAASANSIEALWISMIPAALLQQNFNILKALFGEYHESTATPSERAGSVGMLGMAAGLAFMIGPLAGSTIIQNYEQASACSIICLILAAVVICLLPAPPRHHLSRQSTPTFTNKGTTEKWFDLVPAARTPAAIFLMAARTCMGLAFHIFQTIWTVALQTRFHFGPKEYGRYYAFIGLAFAISQGFVAKFLLKRFGKTVQGRTRLLMSCALVLGGGRLFVYQTTNLVLVYTLYGAIVMALGVVNTIFTADTSNIAQPQELGGLFGVLASVESFAGIAGPVLGGLLAKIDPVQAPLMAVVSLYGIIFAMVYCGYERIVAQPRKTVSFAQQTSSTSKKME